MTLNNLNNNTNCVAEIKEADVLQNSMKQMKIQTDSSEVAVDDCGLPCVKLKFFILSFKRRQYLSVKSIRR